MRPFILNESVAAGATETFTVVFQDPALLKLLSFYFPANQQMLLHTTVKKKDKRGSIQPMFNAIGDNVYISGSGDSAPKFYINEYMEAGDALVFECENTDPSDAQTIFCTVQGVLVSG